MESLFKLTELETRFSAQHERAVGRADAAACCRCATCSRSGSSTARSCWCGARDSGSARSSTASRCSTATSIAYLNLDEVIRIVRFEDEPKAKLIARFKLTDVQAEAILNLRLQVAVAARGDRDQAEHDKLTKERRELKALLKSDEQQWEPHRRGGEGDVGKPFARRPRSARAARRSPTRPTSRVDLEQAMIEKEPITVILLGEGLDPCPEGAHGRRVQARVQGGRRPQARRARRRRPTSCCCSPPTARCSRWPADQLPGGRGHGEPVRLMVDLRREPRRSSRSSCTSRAASCWSRPRSGHGFIVPEDEVVAMTRKGKQVMNVDEPAEACVCMPAEGDMVATIGENRKMLIFRADELPEMSRGKGVRLQRFKDGGLSDVRAVQEGRRARLARSGRPHLHRRPLRGAEGLGRRARPGRAPCAARLPEVQQVRSGILNTPSTRRG